MINIRYTEFDGVAMTVQVTGHAHYAEEGKDIVCAGVSALLCTLADNIERISDVHAIKLDKGDAIVSCVPLADRMIETVITFGTIVRGFRLMESAYPDHVKLTED